MLLPKKERQGRNNNILLLKSLSSGMSLKSTFNNSASLYTHRTLDSEDPRRGNKEFRQMIKQNKMKKLDELNSTYKTEIKQKFNENFKISNEDTLVKVERNESSFHNTNPNLPSSDRRSRNSYNLSFRGNLNDSSTLGKFINNTNILKTKHFLLNLKVDHAVRLKEDIANEVGEIVEKIHSNKESSNLMIKTFDFKYKIFLDALYEDREKERSLLRALYDEGFEINLEIKRLNYAIAKARRNSDTLIDYKKFFICLKERVVDLPSRFLSKLYEDTSKDIFENLIEKIKVKNKKKGNALNLRRKNSLKLPGRRKALNLNYIELDKKGKDPLIKYYKYFADPVYDTKEDFFNDFQKLEKDNLSLIKNYTINNTIILDYKKDLKTVLESEKQNKSFYFDKIKSCEEKLESLRKINKYLNSEKENLEKERHKQKMRNDYSYFLLYSVMNLKKNSNNIVLKISDVYDNMIKIIPKDFYERNSQVNSVNLNKDNNGLKPSVITKLKLNELEKVLYILISQYKAYKEDSLSKSKLKYVESKFEVERLAMKALDQKKKEESALSKLRESILVNGNKTSYLKARKVAEKLKPKSVKAQYNLTETSKLNDKEFIDLLF